MSFLAVFVTILAFLNGSTTPLQPTPRASLSHTDVVNASAEFFWNQLVGADADLRIGTEITLGQPGVAPASHVVRAYEPGRMLAISRVAPPSVPAESRAISDTAFTVIRLEPISADRTRVTTTLVGCSAPEKYAPLCENLYAVDRALVTRVANMVASLNRDASPEALKNVEQLLHRLAGTWRFSKPMPDGGAFSGVTTGKILFDGKLLVVDGFLTIQDKTFQHSHLMGALDPETRQMRIWSFNEKGDITQGRAWAEGDNKLILDWDTWQMDDGRLVKYRVEHIFSSPDRFACAILGPADSDGDRATLVEVVYTRDTTEIPSKP